MPLARTVNGQPLLPPLNRCAECNHEAWVVVEVTPAGLELIETQPTQARAAHAVEVLTNHERKNGRDTVYEAHHAPLKEQPRA